VRDESGEVGGVFALSATTGRVLGDRCLQTLGLLASETAQARRLKPPCRRAIQALATMLTTFRLRCYRVEADGKQALVETAGIEAETSATPVSGFNLQP